MFEKLNPSLYYRVRGLIKNSPYELSVLSVLEGIMPGEIFVDNEDNPQSALIKTSECNLLVGDASNHGFNTAVKGELDFWDQVLLNTEEWEQKIPEFHPDCMIQKYKRRLYELRELKYRDYQRELKEGFWLEKVDPVRLGEENLVNARKVLDWADDWGEAENFLKFGAGFMIRNADTIVSWSLADCALGNKIAIGVQTDAKYRRNGFGAIVVAATVEECLTKGYESIDWHCVDTNVGSIAIAEKVGFTKILDYYAYTPYAPIENESDLTRAEWADWARYFEEANLTLPKFYLEAACAWAKAYEVEGVISALKQLVASGFEGNMQELAGAGLFRRFAEDVRWKAYIAELEQ